MSAHLRQLIDCLHRQDIRPASEELADVLWLALRMGELEKPKLPSKKAGRGSRTEVETEQTFPDQDAEALTESGASTIPPREEQRFPLFAESAPATAPAADETTTGAQPLRTPAAPALPEALALSRALRPLLRKVPSRRRAVIDETATAERYADRKLWLPVFKGQPERWLELALVVEDSPSMRVWQPTLADLYRLLARHGAFRDVRWWRLSFDPKGRPVLSKPTAGSQPRAPEELLHPEGRRLVIVVSDCTAPSWYDPRLFDPWLRLWGQRHPLALLHLLPPRYWPRGGLGRARFTQFRALAPGQPNPQLIPDNTSLPAGAFYLPVFTLEPESVALWAHMLAGHGEIRCPGGVLDNTVIALPPRDGAQVPAQQRLSDFRRSASPEAQLLARYCATVPLTLPVMRLLQTEVLPQTQQRHLAEIFLSGLLRRRNPEETDPERFIYDFQPELRAMLLDTLRAPQILDIHQHLSDAVQRNLGRSADFLAFIPDLLEEGGLRLDVNSLPFAEVGVTVLRRLGGRYLERAERLARVAAAIAAGRRVDSQAVTSPLEREAIPVEPVAPTPFRDRFPDGTPGPKMIWLPGGTFTMGDDKSGYSSEKPAHPVTLSHFGIGQYPVTFEEYDRFCEATRREKPDDWGWGRATRPVINISWEDATAYCEWLSEQTGAHYRMLTETEWEYACRAGSSTRYGYGDSQQRLEEYAWYASNAGSKTHPVGGKLANAWGLYDMHGNVWEWVQDWYGGYSKEPQQDPSGPESGSGRVIRGGSWLDDAAICRSAYRGYALPGYRYDYLGFRLARLGPLSSYPFTLTTSLSPETPVQGYKPYQGIKDLLKDGSEAPEMVYLPSGTFKMGDIQGKGDKDERPVHEVTLDAFAIGRYPVTVGEFRRFVDATAYKTEAERAGGAYVYDGKEWGEKSDANWRNPYFPQEDTHPVVCLSWNDAKAYCQWLSEQTGEQYSLPTEAEWEYACRAASQTAYCFGDHEQQLGEYAWYWGNAERKTHPVGQKRANAWGLYDMHGNVWEWVQDWYGDYSGRSQSGVWSKVRSWLGSSSEQPQRNPSGPESGSARVLRGGSWSRGAGDCRSACRDSAHPGDRDSALGGRLARRV